MLCEMIQMCSCYTKSRYQKLNDLIPSHLNDVITCLHLSSQTFDFCVLCRMCHHLMDLPQCDVSKGEKEKGEWEGRKGKEEAGPSRGHTRRDND